MSKDLLEMNRLPTLEEMREFFKKNDFSAASYIDTDYSKMDADTIKETKRIKKLMDEHWEPLTREMGLKSASHYYGEDNPLIAMRDNAQDLVAGGVMKLLNEHPDRVDEILSYYTGDPNIDENADNMLYNAVDTLLQVMDYEEIAKAVQDTPAHEDFKENQPNNYRAMDFDRSWNHTRSKVQSVPLEQIDRDKDYVAIQIPDATARVEEDVVASVAFQEFWCSLSVEDQKLLQMKMRGMTQADIAERLGYKTHSAVTKRLKKLKKKFEDYMK